MQRYFQSRLQRALAWYAIVPVLVITLLGTALMLASWQRSVVQANEEAREAAAEALSEAGREFLQRTGEAAEFLGAVPDFSLWREDRGKRAEALARLHHDTSRRGVAFYLLDAEGRLMLGSGPLPDCLQYAEEGWGLWDRLQREPQLPRQEWLPGAGGQALVCGQAVQSGGQTVGAIFFLLPAAYLQELAGEGPTCLVLTDELDNARLVKGDGAPVKYRKLRKEFAEQGEGLVMLEENLYYVTSRQVELGSGTGRVYAITGVSDLLLRYAFGAGALALAVLLMIPLLLRSIERESRLTAQALDDQTAIAQLKELESQFNPHFLFNTLENIKFMVRLDPGAATEMLMALSSLLRYSISGGGRQVELQEDLKYLASYMKIQQYRFGSRLAFQQEIDSGALSCRIPKLLFQPLLENAIKYGEDEEGKLDISFQIRAAGKGVEITVRDRGRGIGAEQLAELQALLSSGDNNTGHKGLFNVQRRVQLLYGEKYGLKIACPPEGGTEIKLLLPLYLT
ncbi:MAG: sensor histidine kinase [Selenomonas sp.]|nr:sensor histidine kinase [Selenomonas sp.]